MNEIFNLLIFNIIYGSSNRNLSGLVEMLCQVTFLWRGCRKVAIAMSKL